MSQIIDMSTYSIARQEREPLVRHLMFFFDGTWNSAVTGRYDDTTNVFRINTSINSADNYGVPQISFYVPGPGNRGIGDKTFGGVFGQGLDQIIKEAYFNLSANYWPGDKIYFFGFSRGAVAARALSALLEKIGLLKPNYLDRFSFAWRYFIAANPSSRIIKEKESLIDPHLQPSPQIEMMGLFDPVLGRDYNRGSRFVEVVFSDRNISSVVRYGLQILSIDDNRMRYKPVLWHSCRVNQVVEQIWMPGVHSDIGGVGTDEAGNPSLIAVIAYLTMIDRVRRHTALGLDDKYINSIQSMVPNYSRIFVSNERVGAMRFLRHALRNPDKEAVGQLVHPLLSNIADRRIYIRGKYRPYIGPSVRSFDCLDLADLDQNFPSAELINGVIARMQ